MTERQRLVFVIVTTGGLLILYGAYKALPGFIGANWALAERLVNG